MNKDTIKFRRDKFGAWFDWHGDEICLVRKKYRKDGKKFYSINFESLFYSLDDIDDLWSRYFKDMLDDGLDDSIIGALP